MSQNEKRDSSGAEAGDEPRVDGTSEAAGASAPSGGRRQRIRRPEPERTAPDRSPSGVFRTGGSSTGDSSTGNPSKETSAKGPFETIERGVREGYRVVEDYLREGQRVARQINRRQYGPRQMGDDLQSLAGRMFRDSTRLLGLWVELMSSSVETLWGGGRPGPAGRPSPTDRTGDDAERDAADTEATAVTVEVASPHPARVTVHLTAGAAGQPLRPTPLSGDPGAPPLTDVAFERGGPDEPPVLRIRVPADQPPGIYHGVLVEPASHDHRGTVKVELRAPAKQPAAATKKSAAKKSAAKKSSSKKSAGSSGSSTTKSERSSGKERA